MKASILNLRYNMKEVLKALARNEVVEIFYHGKLKGTILPYQKKSDKKVQDHPFFGMLAKEKKSVEKVMNQLRGVRHHAF